MSIGILTAWSMVSVPRGKIFEIGDPPDVFFFFFLSIFKLNGKRMSYFLS